MKKRFWIGIVIAGSGLTAVSALAQTQTQTVMGKAGTLFGVQVSSWARLDGQNAVQEVGMTLPIKAVENAPVPTASETPPTEAEAIAALRAGPLLRLELPDVVKQTTFLDHIDVFWEKFGHPPDRYLTPHFDVHSFGIPGESTDKIDCKNLTPPDLALTPKDFAPAVPPGVDPATVCVPMMGFHGFALSEFASPGQFKPGLFDYTLISGFYDNKFIFTEPMITKAFLMKKQGFSSAVNRPATVGRNTLYPTRVSLRFDAQQNAFELVYSQFEKGQ